MPTSLSPRLSLSPVQKNLPKPHFLSDYDQMLDRRFFPLLCLLVLAPRTIDAAFTRPAHWKLDSIEHTYAGVWCFYPVLKPTPLRACSNTTLDALVKTHINNKQSPGLSIAFYDLKDNSVLGGSGWSDWSDVVLPVGVCMSGLVDAFDKTYSTTCRFAVADDDHDIPSSHFEECFVNRPQFRVTDGCYTPPPGRPRFRLDDSASGILTIIGLLIALPSIAFGAYRWYCARRMLQKTEVEDGQAVPLVPVGGGSTTAAVDAASSQESPR